MSPFELCIFALAAGRIGYMLAETHGYQREAVEARRREHAIEAVHAGRTG